MNAREDLYQKIADEFGIAREDVKQLCFTGFYSINAKPRTFASQEDMIRATVKLALKLRGKL